MYRAGVRRTVKHRAAHCPRCGTATTARRVEGRERAYCPACERPVYRNPAPCAGVAVVDGDRVLVVERAIAPNPGTWAVPGGYLEVDEPPRAGAVRELREEAGVRAREDDLRLVGTYFLERDRDTVVSILYAVPADRTEGDPAAGRESRSVRFVTPGDAAGMDMAPSHAERVADAVAAVR